MKKVRSTEVKQLVQDQMLINVKASSQPLEPS